MRIAGVNLPKNKFVVVALTYLYGIGSSNAYKICDATNVKANVKVSDLSDDESSSISSYINKNFVVEGDLRKKVSMDIKNLIDIGCYRGLRHRRNLPVRGQNTHSNARTRKGRSRVPVAGKKKAV